MKRYENMFVYFVDLYWLKRKFRKFRVLHRTHYSSKPLNEGTISVHTMFWFWCLSSLSASIREPHDVNPAFHDI